MEIGGIEGWKIQKESKWKNFICSYFSFPPLQRSVLRVSVGVR